MLCGVLTFGYGGMSGFEQQLLELGHYTVNLGDNAQSLAIRALLHRTISPRHKIIDVDRDQLSTYTGEPVVVLMNGVFLSHTPPPSDDVIPIFIGFSAKTPAIDSWLPYLRAHEPIGCRDLATCDLLTSRGVSAFVSGCVTLTLPARAASPSTPKLFVVYGSYAGRLPIGILQYVPANLLTNAELVFNRLPVFEYPLSHRMQRAAEFYEESVLKILSEQATLVLTPLHHIAAPCMALKIPLVICREQFDARFSFLSTLMPIYTPETMADINWTPQVADIDHVRRDMVALIRRKLSEVGVDLIN